MIVVNKEDCIRCGACEGICPTTAIQVTPENVIYCDICGGAPKCVDICPQDALKLEDMVLDESGTTLGRIVFSPEKCNECGDCVDVCPPQTLKLEEGKVKKIPLQGFCVMCQKCVDICPVDVIGVDGVKEPAKLDVVIEGPIFITGCVGCNMCVPECPVDAITLEEIGGSIEIDADKCIKCGVCSQTCPWNAVYISGKKPEKRSKEMKKFELDEETCIGCNICVEACPGDFIVPKESNLTVELPAICTACGLCENICPVDAIDLEVELGPAKPASEDGLVYDADKCDFIGECAQICPNDAIRVVTKTGMKLPDQVKVDEDPSFNMCTRCGACTVSCPEGALSLVDMDKVIDGKVSKRKRVQYNPSLCNECGDCIDVCPYDMLKLTEEKVPLKGFCILCDQCISACPKNALYLK
ncbi:MAG: 4Fe-4S binding protein [Euryarchaeota archaeon]|nr:4Fe-4S binding protein [Euryarchaeota archaeon]MBV1754471.1 4Fe-4S binding protein [Methanobacterium sp.]